MPLPIGEDEFWAGVNLPAGAWLVVSSECLGSCKGLLGLMPGLGLAVVRLWDDGLCTSDLCRIRPCKAKREACSGACEYRDPPGPFGKCEEVKLGAQESIGEETRAGAEDAGGLK